MRFARLFAAVLLVWTTAASASADPDHWDQDPANSTSVTLQPVREDAVTQDGVRLAIKHFPNPGMQPVLMIHGLAQNDRGWDEAIVRYSMARYLHAQGFDVWVGNLRAAGTAGFRSETPDGPHHWTVDDYAAYDVPALVNAVRAGTGQTPFLVGHSLAAWAFEGYLAGGGYDSSGSFVAHPAMLSARQAQIKGIITLAGVYNLTWDKDVSTALTDPIRSEWDYYHSNYELELLAGVKPLYHVIPNLPALPLGWIGAVLNLPFDKIPWIGSKLASLYTGFQDDVVRTPVLSMFYYAPSVDPDMVRLHGKDGLEDLGPHLIEQLANAINDKGTSAYYHIDRPDGVYNYRAVRRHVTVPMLFIAGGRDRLANATMIYRDGYLATQTQDKQFIPVDLAGHLDIITGLHAPRDVMDPVARWIRARM